MLYDRSKSKSAGKGFPQNHPRFEVCPHKRNFNRFFELHQISLADTRLVF